MEESILGKKADISEVERLLNRKVDREQLEAAMGSKAGATEMERARGNIDQLKKMLETKVDRREHSQNNEQTLKKFSQINQDLNLKSNIKDVCLLLDQKSNIDDVNKALTQIHDELDTKTPND